MDKRDNWLVFIVLSHFSSIHRSLGVKESDTGLASPNLWDLAADRQRMGEEHPLQVARCTKIWLRIGGLSLLCLLAHLCSCPSLCAG